MGIFGLLGERLAHSFSPFIHAELCDYQYLLYEKNPDELDSFFKNSGFDGINVTIPYKKAVVPYCKSLSETAQIIGSVNTIIRRPDGSFHGDNTDYYGLLYQLKKAKVDFSCGKTIVLGSGGSSLTVQAVLADMNALEAVVISRNGVNNYSNIHMHHDAICIINTTPVGMYPANGLSPIEDLKPFKNCRAVIDIIFNPARTELMFQAEELKIPAQNGLAMLVAQAKKAAEIFTNTSIDDSKIEEIITKIESKTKNIILIGMPGCGKTSIGKALAAKTGRNFADSDNLITDTSGRSIPDIFNNDGEDAFRKLETDALKTLCKQSGLVIATGGGVVMRPENKNIIRQNGIVVYLDRDIADLPVTNRPVSMRDGISALAAIRQPLYRQWSDYILPVRDIDIAAESLCQMFFKGV